jgi:hypothetical protein
MTQNVKRRTFQNTLVLGLVFFAVVSNLWAQNRPDLVVEKIFTTKECKLAVTVKNNGPGFVSKLVYADYEQKAVGVQVSIDGKDWGEKKFWQFDKIRKLRVPEGTVTCVFDYIVKTRVEVTAAVDVYNILRETEEDNNTLTQTVICVPISKSPRAKPRYKPAAPATPAPVAKKPPRQFILDFKDIYLAYKKSFDSLRVVRDSDVLSHSGNWRKCRVKPHLYHIRQESWEGFFWEIDTGKKEVYKVTGGDFCVPGGSKEKIPGTVEERGDFFYIRFPDTSLVYTPATKSMQVVAARAVLTDGGDWEKCNLSNSQYHLKEGFWSFSFWKVDTLSLEQNHVFSYQTERSTGRIGPILFLSVPGYGTTKRAICRGFQIR